MSTEGMEILSKVPITEPATIIYILIIAGSIISFGAIFYLILICSGVIKDKDSSTTCIPNTFKFIFGGITVLILATFLSFFLKVETGRYTYKCTIDDNVSASYISDNFNIISVENGVWTISDKE